MKLLAISLLLRMVYGIGIAYFHPIPIYAIGILIALAVGVIALYYCPRYKIRGYLCNYLYIYGFLFCMTPFYFITGLPLVFKNSSILLILALFMPCFFEIYLVYMGYKAINFYIDNLEKLKKEKPYSPKERKIKL